MKNDLTTLPAIKDWLPQMAIDEDLDPESITPERAAEMGAHLPSGEWLAVKPPRIAKTRWSKWHLTMIAPASSW